jgi:putative protease
VLTGTVQWGEPVTVTAADEEGHTAVVTGEIPEAAVKKEITAQEVTRQLSKTGGTPYLAEARAQVAEGLSLPLSQLNGLRREALEELNRQRTAVPDHRQVAWKLPQSRRGEAETGGFTLSVEHLNQVTEEMLAASPARVDIPLEEGARNVQRVKELAQRVPLAVTLPRVLWDREHPKAEGELKRLQEAGVTQAVANTWGGVALAKRLGFSVVGGYSLGVYNSETVRGLEELGLTSATVSFEQRLPRIRDLDHAIPLEMIVYGRLPLMIMENCIIRNRVVQGGEKGTSCGRACEKGSQILTDRKGAGFPVIRAYGCRNELLNSTILYLADKKADWTRLGISLFQLRFTTESPEECSRIFARYLEQGDWSPEEYTRGLYYREVE